MSAIGRVLNERYQLDSLLGAGGFASVYRATDLVLQRAVAVKLLHPHLQQEPGFAERFEREARVVARFDHPNILGIHDFGQAEGTLFLVMPHVTDGSLAARLANQGKLPLVEATRAIAQIAAGLDYAHEQGIIHRDVKPANVLIGPRGRLLLADFGLASLQAASGAYAASQTAGTVAYMAPEQFDGRSSPASDVYALGCVAFELLTGELPFGGSVQQIIAGHLNRPPPSIVERSEHQVSAAVQLVIERALKKAPGLRFQSAGAFAEALADVAGLTQATAASQQPTAPALPQVPPSAQPLRGTPPELAATVPVLAPRERRGRRLPIGEAIGLLAFVLAVALIIRTAMGGEQTTTATPTTSPVGLAASAAPAPLLTSGDATPTVLVSTPTATLGQTPTAVRAAAIAATPNNGVPSLVPGPVIRDLDSGGDKSAWSPDGSVLAVATSNSNSVRLWNTDGTPRATLALHTAQITDLAWSQAPSRTLATASRDGTVRLWNSDGTPVATLAGHTPSVISISWSPDGKSLASMSFDGPVRIWSVTGAAITTLTGQQPPIADLAWSPDGLTIAISSFTDAVWLWSIAGTRAESRAKLAGHTGGVYSVAWSPDGRTLATISADGTARLWNADGSARSVIELPGEGGTLAWSPDGSRLATRTSGEIIQIWTVDGQQVGTLHPEPDTNLWVFTWSPDGRVLITPMQNGGLQLWSPEGTKLAEVMGHTARVVDLAWSLDGRMLATSSEDFTVRLWTYVP